MACSNALARKARARAVRTGTTTLVTGEGHIWFADAHNRRLAKEFGGIACIVRPPRRRVRDAIKQR